MGAIHQAKTNRPQSRKVSELVTAVEVIVPGSVISIGKQFFERDDYRFTMQLLDTRTGYVEINRAQVRRRLARQAEAQKAAAERARIEAIGPVHDQPAPKYKQ